MPNEVTKKIELASKNFFEKYSFWGLVRGRSIYDMDIFYDLCQLFLEHEEIGGYINYGLWSEGENTKNPCLEMSRFLGSALRLTPGDIVLDVGSGYGQPLIDLITHFSIEKGIGINTSSAQIAHATTRAGLSGVAEKVVFLHIEPKENYEHLRNERIGKAFSISVFSETKDATPFFSNLSRLLPRKGLFALGEFIIKEVRLNLFRRLESFFWFQIQKLVYADHWRTLRAYNDIAAKNGFTVVSLQEIGSKIFPFDRNNTLRKAPLLRKNSIPMSARLLTYLSHFAVYRLHKLGVLDYVVVLYQKI